MKKALLIAVLLGLTWLSSNAYALSTGLDLNKLPIHEDIKKFENKEYNTTNEYIEAFNAGRCSSVWLWIHLDKSAKIELVNGIKHMVREKENVIVNKPAKFYVHEIDDVIANDPATIDYAIMALFRAIAVMEYDYDEGIDKEETAKKWLGSIYPAFKRGQEQHR